MEHNSWKEYVIARCSELEPKVMGESLPSSEDAMMYFKMHDIMFNVFGLGRDLSQHPRNPSRDKEQKTLDKKEKILQPIKVMTIKEQELIDYLQVEITALYPRIFGDAEPTFTDRLTFFAYHQFLFRKFNIGVDMKDDPRNPWVGKDAPMDFSGYSQIRALPENLQEKKLNQTQKIPAVKKPLQLPAPEPKTTLWRAFDVDTPDKTVFQGDEEMCQKFVAQANEDSGYNAFDYRNTSITYTPDVSKENGISKLFQTNSASFFVCKTSKEKVLEYLSKQNKEKSLIIK
jgi:hypothetical protein